LESPHYSDQRPVAGGHRSWSRNQVPEADAPNPTFARRGTRQGHVGLFTKSSVGACPSRFGRRQTGNNRGCHSEWWTDGNLGSPGNAARYRSNWRL